MTDLHKFFLNPFDDPKITVDDLLAFATDHQQRLTANNPGGVYAARLAATASAVSAVNGAFVEDQTKLAVRKGRKLAKDSFRRALPDTMTRLHAAVVGKYGAKSAEVAMCFPAGRTVFRECPDDQMGNHLQTLVAGLTACQPGLGAATLTEANGLLTGWNGVYTVSESASGARTSSLAAKKAARMALQLELFRNLLTLAMAYPREPEALDTYMQQSLLEPPKSAPQKPAPAPAPAP